MTVVSNIALLETIRETGLLGGEQLDALRRQLPGRLVDARALARLMLQQGWLTVYQINQLLAGQGRELVVGPYHVLEKLGQGGQSTVYKARHTGDGLVVALKVIRAELTAAPEASQQFLQEMEAMAALEHPNVVQLYDADRAGQTCYCALEYVEGTDLGKYVRLNGPLPAAEACDYVRQAALGLQHAHERSLIHRDVKPVNLYLTEAPGGAGAVIKILDWGLASLRPPGPAQNPSASSCKLLVGTADYLSPEQALDPDGVDIRGDIYSLGCTFYYLLAGHPPFPDGTVMQKILRHQREEPPPVERFRPDLPLGLAAIVRRMLAKAPGERYQTPASVAMALGPFCRADRFLLPGMNRETRHRLGLEPGADGQDTPRPGALLGDTSTGSSLGTSTKQDIGIPERQEAPRRGR